VTIQQLQYFLAAARVGTISGAAQSLHLAQPSLSEQIRRLEAELGVDLFVRTRRGLVLTAAGEAFRPEAERVMGGLERAREAVASVRELRGGTVSFGTFGSARWYGLVEVVETLRREHPDVRVRATGQNSSEVADLVRDGELEAALVVLPIDDQGLDVRPAIRDEVLYASADPDRVRQRMSIKRLAEAPLILYDARWGDVDPTRRQLAARAQHAGIRLEPIIEVEDVEVALELVVRGHGDTFLARAIATHPEVAPRVHTVTFTEPLYDTFAFISRRGAHLSPGSRAVVEAAERLLEEQTRFGEPV
jgi:DNA-binding transcriptional LysR family regulator